ncbi:response regulator [Flavisolibacter ginsenosidimutans]|uniref:Response regulator n=1 Tax=Flavisolibacter ginsenosidimutans TaxID=661481 RepID=A0A5B8UM08_9BACT|nr:response regulator [Flavisolibacter ginsenosidimutans]QEC57209.1 response regulator [Flavisolibacter ginsenosidimutans]
MVKRKILIAEDDADDQQFFTDFLQLRTDVVLLPIVENGEELLKALNNLSYENDLPHYIILDQNMPRKNGLQTLQTLKADERFSHIPVMIYSTFTDENLIQCGAESGACLVFPKPLSKAGYNEMLDALFATAG